MRFLAPPLVALLLPGAGAFDRDPAALPADVPRVATEAAPADARRAIEGWVGAVRRADFPAATRFFTVPTLVQNGSPVLELGSGRAIAAWNRSLPCGAVLTRLRGTGAEGWTIATFRLVERRGGACGAGAGGTATSAIKVRDGRIERWHRLPGPGAAPDTPSIPSRAV